MFHLIIGMWAMGLFVWAVILALIPLWLGPLLQLVIGLFSRGPIAKWVPAVLGAIGLSSSFYSFCMENQFFPFWSVLLYWAVYGLLIWAAYSMADRFRTWWTNRRRRR